MSLCVLQSDAAVNRNYIVANTDVHLGTPLRVSLCVCASALGTWPTPAMYMAIHWTVPQHIWTAIRCQAPGKQTP